MTEFDAIGAVRKLKEQSGGDLHIMGSVSFASQLVSGGLVDEYNLMIEPIVLGGGKRLFPTDGESRPLELVSVEQAKTGVLVCKYRPA